ncbi:MAG: hypothetical protein PHW24_04590 [Candidatus Moranbacteria bacterium]|nr:hypothetical protein [Candidatus Moranbacteria bacterium]
MQKQLDEAIEKYKNSQTSLEAYEAISDFVKIIVEVPEFIKQVEAEGEKIRIAQRELNADKGWTYGLRGRELDKHNENRGKKWETLCQLDPSFPLSELETIHDWLQSENMTYTALLFQNCKPDDALSESERKRYQGFIDKLYKKVIPFLKKEAVEEIPTEIILPKVEPAKTSPENTGWENITIKFLNDYDVEIKNGSKISKADYTQMGFADERINNEQETKAKESWKLLHYFSINNNVFSLNASRKENDKHKKRKQELSCLLREYFKLKDDPILYDKAKKEYRLKIKLIPEKTFADQWQDRNIFEENSL